MSSNLIEIVLRLKNELGTTLTKAQAELGAFANAAQGLNSQAGQAGKGLASLAGDATKAGTAVAGSAAGMGVAASAAGSMASKMEGAVLGMRQLGLAAVAFVSLNFIKDILAASGRTEQLGIVLQQVGTNAGISVPALNEMDKAVQGMGITASASRDSLTKLIQAQLITAQTGYKASQLARASQDLAVVTGQNSSETFQRLIVNIQQMDTVGLRHMGITVNMEEAQDKYARTIGKTASALTQNEKQQAALNAVLNEASKLAGTYEASMGSAAKQAASLARYQEDLKVSLGNALQPAYLAVVEGITAMIQALTGASNAMTGSKEIGRALGEVVKSLMDRLVSLTKVLADHKEVILAVTAAWAAMKVPAAFAAFEGFAKTITGSANAMNLLGAAFERGSTSFNNLTQKFTTIEAGPLGGLTKAFDKVKGSIVGAFSGAGTKIAAPFRAAITSVATSFPVLGTAATAASTAVSGAMGAAKLAVAGLKVALMGVATIGAALFVGWEIGSALNQFQVVRDSARVAVFAILDSFNWLVNQAQEKFLMLGRMGATALAFITPGKSASATWEEWGKKVQVAQEKTAASFDNTKEAIGEFGKIDNTEAINKANELFGSYTEAQTAVMGIRKELDQARAAAARGDGDETLIKRLEADLKVAEKKFKDVNKELAELKAGVSDKTAAEIDVIFTTDKVTRQNLLLQLGNLKTQFDEAKKTLGLDKVQFIDGRAVSQEFSTARDAAKSLIESYRDAAANLSKFGEGAKDVTASIQQVELSMVKLAAQANTPEEIADMMKLLSETTALASESMKQLNLNLSFKQGEAEMKRLEEATTGLQKGLTLVTEELSKQRQWLLDVAKADDAFVESMSKLKLDTNSSAEALDQLSKNVKTYGQELTAIAAIDLRKQSDAFSDASARYTAELQTLKTVTASKVKIIEESTRSEAEKATALTQLYQETLKQRGQATQSYFDRLKGLQSEALAKFTEYAQKVRDLDQGIFEAQKSNREFQREFNRSLMGDAEAQADRKKELAEKVAATERDLAAGNLEGAKQSAQEQIDLARQIANDTTLSMEDRKEAAKIAENGTNSLTAAMAAQKAEALKAAEEQQKVYQGLTDQLVKVAEQLTSMSKQQVISVKSEFDSAGITQAKELVDSLNKDTQLRIKTEVDTAPLDQITTRVYEMNEKGEKVLISTTVDQGSLDDSSQKVKSTFEKTRANILVDADRNSLVSAANDIRNALSNIVVNVTARVQSSSGYSSGGFVSGPGTSTSDSIWARLSNGEFVMKAEAVNRYGVDFFHALNGMITPSVPRFATGGLVGEAGPVSVGGDQAVNITLGKKKVSLRGKREQVREFVSLMQQM